MTYHPHLGLTHSPRLRRPARPPMSTVAVIQEAIATEGVLRDLGVTASRIVSHIARTGDVDRAVRVAMGHGGTDEPAIRAELSDLLVRIGRGS